MVTAARWRALPTAKVELAPAPFRSELIPCRPWACGVLLSCAIAGPVSAQNRPVELQVDGTPTFRLFMHSQTISIHLLNDDVQKEYEQTCSVMSNALDLPIGRDTATIAIRDDEERPQILIGVSEAPEGGA